MNTTFNKLLRIKYKITFSKYFERYLYYAIGKYFLYKASSKRKYFKNFISIFNENIFLVK